MFFYRVCTRLEEFRCYLLPFGQYFALLKVLLSSVVSEGERKFLRRKKYKNAGSVSEEGRTAETEASCGHTMV